MTSTKNDMNNMNSNLALPVLKINDINIQSSNNSPTHSNSKEENKSRNLVDLSSLNLEAQLTENNNNNADEESEEYDEEESGDEDDEDAIDTLEHNILKALRNQRHDQYDIYR